MAMPSMTSAAESQSTAQAAKTIVGLTATSTPPSAGPATTAACAAEFDAAIARGRTAGRHDVGQHRLQARLLEGAAGADHERHGQQQVPA